MSSAPIATRRLWICLALVLAGLLPAIAVLVYAGPLVDESQHLPQILMLRTGELAQHPEVTTPPTYHALIAGLSRLLAVDTLPGLRYLTLALSLLSLAVAYLIVRRLAPDEAPLRAAQLFFLPIAYPFFFLLYTDLVSLLLVLAALERTLARRPSAAGILAGLAVAVRQSNVVWLLFLPVLAWLREDRSEGSPSWRDLLAHLRRSWAFVLSGALFAAFVAWNGGVAMGDRSMHAFGGLRLENLFFSLLTFAVVFLPIHTVVLAESLERLRRRPWLLLLPLAAFGVYLAGFEVDHPYNRVMGYLHNMALDRMTASLPAQVLWFLPIAAAIVSLLGLRLLERPFYALYPFWLLAVLPLWMVEPRYYLVPFALFLLLRRPRERAVEWALIGFFVVCDLTFLACVRAGLFFL